MLNAKPADSSDHDLSQATEKLDAGDSVAVSPLAVPLITGPATIPAFIVRRASSTVEMPSGGSLMLAGLVQNDILSSINGAEKAGEILREVMDTLNEEQGTLRELFTGRFKKAILADKLALQNTERALN